MSLIAGSYERFIWGYKLRRAKPASNADGEQILALAPLFSYPAHLSPVKSVAVAGPVGASAGGDDSVKLYDLSACSELGSVLLHNSASVTSLAFFTPPSLSSFPRNLLAGADDGSVCIFDVDPFVLLKTVPVHKKAVNDLAVHPSGRLGLTVSRDSHLAMVNLVRGRRSFCCRLEKEASIIKYSLDGGRFFMASNAKITVHEAEDARIVGELESTKRVLCAAPSENGLIFTGGEDCGITAWDTLSGKVAHRIANAHETRVKGIVVLTGDGNSGAAENPFLVASASSDGVISVWDIRSTSKDKPKPLSMAETKSRLTSLAGSSIKSFNQPQMRKDASEDDAEAMED